MAAEGELDHCGVPDNMKGLRACLGCSVVKTFSQFYNDGCENCSFLEMENDSSRVHTCTSAYFEGVIAMCQPNNSWVSRWQQIASFLPGMYAVQVVGELPQEDIDMCKAKGFHYREAEKVTGGAKTAKQ